MKLRKRRSKPRTTVEPKLVLNQSALAHYLSTKGIKFSYDKDGDISAVWEMNTFWFLLIGSPVQTLQILSRWHAKFDVPDDTFLHIMINEWNRDNLWPELSLTRQGTITSIMCTHNFPVDAGITPSQLDEQIFVAIDAATDVFNSLTKRFSNVGNK